MLVNDIYERFHGIKEQNDYIVMNIVKRYELKVRADNTQKKVRKK